MNKESPYGLGHNFYADVLGVDGLKSIAINQDHLSRLIAVSRSSVVDIESTSGQREQKSAQFNTMLGILAEYEQQNGIPHSYPPEQARP